MKEAAICGIFTRRSNRSNGQTIKSQNLADALSAEYSADQIYVIDYGSKLDILLMFPRLIFALATCKNVVILPAENALPPMTVWLSFWNFFFKRKLHYVVIGGWLTQYLTNHSITSFLLLKFSGVYVETSSMKKGLDEKGFKNAVMFPNFKKLDFSTNLDSKYSQPLKLATFSRVMKEKGIEEAVSAVQKANKILGHDMFALDIYGQIEVDQQAWFDDLMKECPSCVKYCGVVPSNQSTRVLSNHHALLFPTYYGGEGFAGTLIDAFAASLPPIVSDWHNNAEIVRDKENGLLVPVHDVASLADAIVWSYNNIEQWRVMRQTCMVEAKKYLPENVLPILISRFD